MAASRICSIPNCGKKHYAQNWCYAHYMRNRNHGSPTGGSTGKGEAKAFLDGIAIPYEGDDCLIWPYGTYSNGYGTIVINGKHFTVHKLVCLAVHGTPPGDKIHVAHNCGNGMRGCVNPKHLEWKTPSENAMDKLRHGTHNRGERHHNSKLTLEQVRKIRQSNLTQRELSSIYGVCQATISGIKIGREWAWVTAAPS